MNPNDQSSYKAIASLYENLQKTDEWLDWVTKRSENMSIPPEQRAEALTSLAAKKNTCANDITDTEQTKKTVTGKDGKKEFQFVKPAKPEDYQSLTKCIQEGTALIDQALTTETDQVKTAKSLDIKGLPDDQLKAKMDFLKVYESARSYKASLMVQAMRLAEMDGKSEDAARLKTEAEAARQNFLEISDVVKKIQAEIDDRTAAKEAQDKANKAENKK